jgi:hypothetical protein
VALKIFNLALILTLAAMEYVDAADQVPPLKVIPSEACHIADAKPLLAKEKYSSSKYAIKTLNEKPLTLLESVDLNKNASLMIEQRGCEDIYFKFNIKDNLEKSTDQERLKNATELLKQLKLADKALLNKKQIENMANKLLQTATAKTTDRPKEFYVCLVDIETECITDAKAIVSVTGIEINYVDRP